MERKLDDAEILFGTNGHTATATLNRPKALNALTFGMIQALAPKLRAWGADKTVRQIVLKATGERAFCAGGDVRAAYEAGLAAKRGGKQNPLTRDFFFEEYRLNRQLARFAKPIVSLIDGICMGGGVGLSVHGRFRVATERTLFAMPETAIGLFPDVGGSYFLPRLPGRMGRFLGLTGERLKAADLLHLGLATHYVPSARLAELEAALATDAAERVLAAFNDEAGAPELPSRNAAIERCFAPATIEGILAALDAEGDEWAQKLALRLRKMAPLSLKIALRQLDQGAALSIEDGLRMEFRMVQRCMAADDFYEGIRAVLVDKDHAPKWIPATLDAATDAMVSRYFAPLGHGDELTFID
jgi:enoyl-CoA hydratase